MQPPQAAQAPPARKALYTAGKEATTMAIEPSARDVADGCVAWVQASARTYSMIDPKTNRGFGRLLLLHRSSASGRQDGITCSGTASTRCSSIMNPAPFRATAQ
ncbi:hypothetical protein MTO96_009124 [Rhipicephalus appendiculatus]